MQRLSSLLSDDCEIALVAQSLWRSSAA